MWIIHLLPSGLIPWFVNVIIILGLVSTLAGIFINFLPSIVAPYKLPLQIAGLVLLIVGIYYRGGADAEEYWRDRVVVAEHRAEQAEKKSQEVNTVIVEKEVEKIKYITQVEYRTRTVIKEVEKLIDAECTVRPEVINILNSEARNKVPELNGENK